MVTRKGRDAFLGDDGALRIEKHDDVCFCADSGRGICHNGSAAPCGMGCRAFAGLSSNGTTALILGIVLSMGFGIGLMVAVCVPTVY